MKLLLAIVMVATLAGAAIRVPISRYRANIQRRDLEMTVERAERAFGFERVRLARAAIEQANACLTIDPADYKSLVLRAGAEVALEKRNEAVQTYKRALELNPRPEIFAYLGIVQLESGKVTEAVDNLARASEFNILSTGLVDENTQVLIAAAVRKRRLAAAQ